jgi:hypothetical protein
MRRFEWQAIQCFSIFYVVAINQILPRLIAQKYNYYSGCAKGII